MTAPASPPSTTRLDRLLDFLRDDPTNDQLRADAFDLALETGYTDIAQQLLQSLLPVQRVQPAWLHRAGLSDLRFRRFASAQSRFQELIEAGEDAPAVRYNLAYALFSQKRYALACDTLAPLLADETSSADLPLALWLRGLHQEAKLREGVDRVRRISALRAVSADVIGVASLMAIDLDDRTTASVWSELALSLDPGQQEALVSSGTLALAARDAVAAQAFFAQAIARSEQDGRSWSGMAFARMLALMLEPALKAFDNAVAFMPEHVGTWVGKGWCHYMLGQLPQARSAFEKAITLDRSFGESHGGLAVVMAKQGMRADAMRECELAYKLDPENLSARYAESILSGEVDDPHAFERLARRSLASIGGQLRSSSK